MLGSKAWRDACVVDDVLYYYDNDKRELYGRCVVYD